jgi:hypothetical protein
VRKGVDAAMNVADDVDPHAPSLRIPASEDGCGVIACAF